MAAVQALCLKSLYFVLLNVELFKVSTFANAAPSRNLCDSGSLSFADVDFSNTGFPYLVFEAADKPKKSADVEMKKAAAALVEKMNEMYDLLVESELIENEQRTPEIDFDDTSSYLAAREIAEGGETEPQTIVSKIELKSDTEHIKPNPGGEEVKLFKPEHIESDGEMETNTGSVEPITESEAEYADAETVLDPEQSKMGEKVKQAAQHVVHTVVDNAKQFYDDKMRKPIDGELSREAKLKATGDKMKKVVQEFIQEHAQKAKQYYQNRRKKYSQVADGEPESGVKREGAGAKAKRVFGNARKKINQFFSDKVRKPVSDFFSFKFRLDVNVRPIPINSPADE